MPRVDNDNDDDAVLPIAHCIVCDADMTEPFHLPVQTQCACIARICEFCRKRVANCPTCRRPLVSDGGLVDTDYLEKILVASGSRTCTGCHRFVGPRHVLKHNRECPSLLKARLHDMMDETLQKEKEYRKLMTENTGLRLEMGAMSYQLRYMHRVYGTSFHPLVSSSPPPPSPPSPAPTTTLTTSTTTPTTTSSVPPPPRAPSPFRSELAQDEEGYWDSDGEGMETEVEVHHV
jgi:hypothetical protein